MSTSTCRNLIGRKSKDANICGIQPRCSSTKPKDAVTDLTKSMSERNCSICVRFSCSESRKVDSSLAPKPDSPPSNESNTWNRPEKFSAASTVAMASVECPCQQPHSMTSPCG